MSITHNDLDIELKRIIAALQRVQTANVLVQQGFNVMLRRDTGNNILDVDFMLDDMSNKPCGGMYV